MEQPTCKTCRFWAQPNMVCDGSICDVATDQRPFKSDSIRVITQDGPSLNKATHIYAVFTGPDFGCIHHEPKEQA